MGIERMNFEEFWNVCQEKIKVNDIIPNWSVAGQIIVQEYKILSITKNGINYEGYNPRLHKTLEHYVAKHQFQKFFPCWEDYKNGLLERNKVREISRFSTYIIATMHYVETEIA